MKASAGLRHGIALDKVVTVILSQSDEARPLCGIYFNLHSPYKKIRCPRPSADRRKNRRPPPFQTLLVAHGVARLGVPGSQIRDDIVVLLRPGDFDFRHFNPAR